MVGIHKTRQHLFKLFLRLHYPITIQNISLFASF
jgi:hypothetical protein